MSNYRVYEAEKRTELEPSRFGYIVERDGTIIALDELQIHGRIVYDRHPEVRAHYDSLDEDQKNERKTQAELYSTEDMGFIRVSIAPYTYQWSIGSSRTVLPSPVQLKAIDFLVAVCGCEDMWHDRGEGDWATIRGWMTKPNWGL